MDGCPGISIMKELHKLVRKAEKLFDGQVEFQLDDIFGDKKISINDELDDEKNDGDNIDEKNDENTDENELKVHFYITPNDGLYKGARIKFKMIIDYNDYPSNPPTIECDNEVYHPNIDNSEQDYSSRPICVSLLGSDWSPEVGVDGAVMATLFLFYHPELDDALSTMCCNVSQMEYEHNVFVTLRGGTVEGITFDKLIDDDGSQTCPCCDKLWTDLPESKGKWDEDDIQIVIDSTEVDTDNRLGDLPGGGNDIASTETQIVEWKEIRRPEERKENDVTDNDDNECNEDKDLFLLTDENCGARARVDTFITSRQETEQLPENGMTDRHTDNCHSKVVDDQDSTKTQTQLIDGKPLEGRDDDETHNTDSHFFAISKDQSLVNGRTCRVNSNRLKMWCAYAQDWFRRLKNNSVIRFKKR